MKYEYITLSLCSLCSLIIGITGGFIAGVTAAGPQEPIDALILFGSVIVLALGCIYIIIKK